MTEGYAQQLETIRRFYGDQRARRSNVPYISHIEEGVKVLKELGADDDTIGAWCLHPMVQGDVDLLGTLNDNLLAGMPTMSVLLAMEYRSRANSHLSHDAPKEPRPGPLWQVTVMLIADKIQNRKDFLLHVKDHPDTQNGSRLEAYYQEWLDALGVSDELRDHLTRLITEGVV